MSGALEAEPGVVGGRLQRGGRPSGSSPSPGRAVFGPGGGHTPVAEPGAG